MKPVAIIGAGNGGCAMAADLTLRGFKVHLCEIYSPKRIEDIKIRGGIELAGPAGNGFVQPKLMTTNPAEALENVDFIFWAIPSNGHEFHFQQCASHLKEGQILILTPGGVGGALCLANQLKNARIRNIRVGETCTLPYGCRLTSPFRVEVYDVARDVLFAILPDKETDSILKIIQPLFPNLIPGETLLETSLSYMNLLLHPVGMILNAGWIEHRQGDFAFYYDGISPAVAKVLDEVDQERLKILAALHLPQISFVEWFFRRGKTGNKESVYKAIHESVPNRNFRAPDSLEHRFVLEDVPFALVPLAHFGNLLEIPTPVTHALILLASRMCGRDFMQEGRNLEKMGLSGMSLSQLHHWVKEGSL